MSTPFVFPGTAPYVLACRSNHPSLTLSMVGQALKQPAVGRVTDALAQASLAPEAHRAAVAAAAEDWRDVLALALEGVEAAILDTYRQLGLPAPGLAPDASPAQSAAPSDPPAPKRKGRPDGPR